MTTSPSKAAYATGFSQLRLSIRMSRTKLVPTFHHAHRNAILSSSRQFVPEAEMPDQVNRNTIHNGTSKKFKSVYTHKMVGQLYLTRQGRLNFPYPVLETDILLPGKLANPAVQLQCKQRRRHLRRAQPRAFDHVINGLCFIGQRIIHGGLFRS